MKFIRSHVKAVAEEADIAFFSAGDYSAMVSGFPKDEYDAKNIAEHFVKLGVTVHSVLLVYDVRKYGPVQQELDDATRGV